MFPTALFLQLVCLQRCRLSTLQGEWHEMETKREREKKRKRDEEGGVGGDQD